MASGLDLPWGIDFLDTGETLITEREGHLRLWQNNALAPEPVKGIPAVLAEGQGGLLDVSKGPHYAEDGWIYLSYSHAQAADGANKPNAMSRIVRGRLEGNQWTDQEVIFEAPAYRYLGTRHHYRSRIVFDRQGHVFFSIGD